MKNFLTGMFQKVLALVCTFISRKIFIIYIGIEYLGINSLFANILSMLSLADLGFGVAMSYSFYKPLSEHDEERVGLLISFYKRVYNVIALLILSVGMALMPFLRFFVNLESDIPYLHLYYFVFLLQTVFSYLFVYKATLLNADQKSYVINRISSAANFLKTVAQIISIVIFKKYIVFILIQVVSILIQNAAVSFKADKFFPYIRKSYGKKIDGKLKKEISENMGSMFLYKLSSVMMNSIDSILISKLIGTVILGMYSNYLEVINGLFLFLNILFSSVTASVGNIVARNENEKSLLVFKTLQMLSFYFSSLIITCLVLSYQHFITLWLGAEYLLDTKVVYAACLNFYLSICVMPLWSYREACGIYVRTKYIMLIAAALNLILSVALGMAIGLSGIILASVISRCATYIWFEPKVLFSTVFKRSSKSYFLAFLLNFLFLILIVLFVSQLQRLQFSVSWLTFILENSVACILISLLYLLFFHKRDEFLYLKSIFLRRHSRGQK